MDPRCGFGMIKCGEQFYELFTIARGKDAWAADHMQFRNGNNHWNIFFTIHVHDWEVESGVLCVEGGFLGKIFFFYKKRKIHQKCKGLQPEYTCSIQR